MIRALIFDLDDTLYCEGDFVASGYLAVAKQLSAACGAPSGEIHKTMMAILSAEGRRRVMPAILEQLAISKLQVTDLVQTYRRHTPDIHMFAGYDDLLRDLRATYRLGILTDGNPAVQKSKCVALGLVGAVDNIVYTWEFGQEREKPHPQGFRMILDRLEVMPGEALFIGDSPEKDCIGARNVGMKCIRVQKPPLTCAKANSDEADFIIESLLQLPLLLRQLEESK